MVVAIVWDLFCDDDEGLSGLEDDPSGFTAKNRWAENYLEPKLVFSITVTLSSELYHDKIERASCRERV